MIDLGVALAWIAISAAGAKGLAAFARTVATTDAESELAFLATEGGATVYGYQSEALHPLCERP